MIRVHSLHIYPIKSCRGIDLSTAEIAATGFRHDRQWMVVTPEGDFLSQRTHPGMARVATRIDSDRLIIDAPGQSRLEVHAAGTAGEELSVTVWKDTCRAVSAGPQAAEWFSSLLGTRCELVRQPDTEIRPVDPRYAGSGDRVAFADGYPFLLISTASVDALNHRLDTKVPADRFRANIIIDGCEPHAEDDWRRITIGDVGFRVAKPCARCVVITTDQHDGGRSTEPLRTLAEYRKIDGKVLFGQNLVHEDRGVIRVGDEVRISRIR